MFDHCNDIMHDWGCVQTKTMTPRRSLQQSLARLEAHLHERSVAIARDEMGEKSKITTQTPVCAPILSRFPLAFGRRANCPEHAVVGLGRIT
jgi:hypothetical protein